MTRTEWKNLNGQWQFKTVAAGEPVPFGVTLPETILVPYLVQSAQSGIQRNENHVWYRRTFTVPSSWSGRRTLLHFGAVTQQADVWVNGIKVGQHTGGYDSFSFDITPHLQGGANELIVKAFAPLDDRQWTIGKQTLRPAGIFYTASTGIWQTVWLACPTLVCGARTIRSCTTSRSRSGTRAAACSTPSAATSACAASDSRRSVA